MAVRDIGNRVGLFGCHIQLIYLRLSFGCPLRPNGALSPGHIDIVRNSKVYGSVRRRRFIDMVIFYISATVPFHVRPWRDYVSNAVVINRSEVQFLFRIICR